MGDIGRPVRIVEFEPFPETVPFEEPAAPSVPAPAPTPEPAPAPAEEPAEAPEREPVPA